jgi:NAD(P)-dependent dehydrogenase (short-subunit alcohol dehydrogenase family)
MSGGRLAGRCAVVTGAAAGIGRAAAVLFAAEGARVALLDIDAEGGARTAATIAAAGGQAEFLATDITSEAGVARAFARIEASLGGADVLLNCAGGSSGRDGRLVDVEMEELWRVLRLDLHGTMLCCRAAIAAMQAKGGGAIVNMTSVVGLVGVPGMDLYTSAKGAVAALTRALAVTHAPDGIRVNAIAPGITLTERVLALSGGDVGRFALARKQVLGPALPGDIAEAALFLASDAARRITGVVLPVDGGASAW